MIILGTNKRFSFFPTDDPKKREEDDQQNKMFYGWLVRELQKIVEGDAPLIGTGDPWACHLPVTLFLENPRHSLTLYFDKLDEAGHREFSRCMSGADDRGSMSGIRRAVDAGAVVRPRREILSIRQPVVVCGELTGLSRRLWNRQSVSGQSGGQSVNSGHLDLREHWLLFQAAIGRIKTPDLRQIRRPVVESAEG